MSNPVQLGLALVTVSFIMIFVIPFSFRSWQNYRDGMVFIHSATKLKSDTVGSITKEWDKNSVARLIKETNRQTWLARLYIAISSIAITQVVFYAQDFAHTHYGTFMFSSIQPVTGTTAIILSVIGIVASVLHSIASDKETQGRKLLKEVQSKYGIKGKLTLKKIAAIDFKSVGA